jgi:hypothetical protein
VNTAVTDPKILEALNAPDPPPKPGERVTDPKILEQLNAPSPGDAPRGGESHPSGMHQPRDALPFTDQVALSQADNIDEKELYFQHKYGKENVSREWSGKEQALMVRMPSGAIYRVGNDSGFVAQLVGDSPKLAGMLAGAGSGAEAGSAGGPWGALLGGVGGAAIGAMGGKTLIEGKKALEGNYAKTPEQYGEALTSTEKEGALGEAGGKLLGESAARLAQFRLPAFITGATDESRAMTKDAWKGGARPPYASMAPNAIKLRRIEVDAEKLTGKYEAQDQRNMAFVIDNLKKTLRGSGMPPAYVDKLADEVSDPSYAASHEAVGNDLKASVQAHVDAMTASVTRMADLADKHIDAQLKPVFDAIDASKDGNLAQQTSDAILAARKQFGEQFSALYSKIDTMTGGAKIVPTDQVASVAREITAQLPKTSVQAIVKEMSTLAKKPVKPEDAVLLKEFGIELPEDGKLTLAQAQRIRTVLKDKAYVNNLTPGYAKHDFGRLADAMDTAIQSAAEDPAAGGAVEMLNAVDAAYKKGLAKFKDAAISQLAKATKSGMPPDPEKIVSLIAQPGYTARASGIRQIVGDDVWRQVQAVHMQQYLRRFTSIGADGKPALDGMKMLNNLRDSDSTKMLAQIHGEDSVANLREIAKMVASREGKLDPALLANHSTRDILTSMQEHQARLDDFMKHNALAILADPSKTGEEAYQWVVRPGAEGEARTMAVAKTFGINSPQMKGVQQAALEELARNANINAINKVGNGALENALSAFTKNQQDLLFPDGLASDMRQISKVIKFMFPFKSGAASDTAMAGMSAGAVLEKPLRERLYKQAVASVMRFVVLHPSVARWVVTGRERDEFVWMVRTADLFRKMGQLGGAEAATPSNDQ